ncbi:MFS general substrate transporter [Penicillium malachiteum]|uniref:MFS general substrate transporter n=1 Tax=Penicillium malachiteum TaxID=1324776 RepID=UPI002548D0AB|nr:MFS general substrate transporter [Penicillium malachiteum]KAJ5715290.1 MFS general substrate transporter [Penicillium malachiteum]
MDSSKSPTDHRVSIDKNVQSDVTVDEYEAFLQLSERFLTDRRKALLRKIELTRIGNAKSFGALDDLGIDGQQ